MRRAAFLALCCLAGPDPGFGPGAVAQPAAPAPSELVSAQVLELQALNRTYQDFAPEIAPIRSAGVTIRLESPRQTLTVRRHRLELRPAGGGAHEGVLEMEFLGKGELVADVDLSGVGNRFEDEVIAPRQVRTLAGRVAFARRAEGWEVTVLEAPEHLAVEIRSRLANRIVGWCDRLSLLPLTAFDCPGLDRALSVARVPLPPPGRSFLLEDAELTAEDRRSLEGYLSGAGAAGER